MATDNYRSQAVYIPGLQRLYTPLFVTVASSSFVSKRRLDLLLYTREFTMSIVHISPSSRSTKPFVTFYRVIVAALISHDYDCRHSTGPREFTRHMCVARVPMLHTRFAGPSSI
jgi:hypothetical protein